MPAGSGERPRDDGPRAPKTTLFLVRHGQSVGNVEKRFGGHGATPLTELGRQQAEAIARRLTPLAPTAVIASDLARAAETAEIIARSAGVLVAIDVGLRERSVGIFDGMRIADARDNHPELFSQLAARDPAFCPPGGEPVAGVHARVSASMDRALREHAGGRIVIVSHALALYHAVLHLIGLGSPADGARVFVTLSNASVSTFSFRDGVCRISGLNDCAHLHTLAQG